MIAWKPGAIILRSHLPWLVCALIVGGAPWAGADPVSVSSLDDLLHEDRWEEALALAREAHGACDGCPEMSGLLGRCLFRAGRFDEASALLEPLAATGAASPRSLITLARLRMAAGRDDEAYATALRARAAAPDDAEVLFWAPEMTTNRLEAVEMIERYLAVADGQSPDRIEAARGTLGLYRELGQRQVWIPVDRPEKAEIPLKPLWEVPGRPSGYMVEVQLGERSKPLRLLLDTGSPGLFVIERKARKHGFEPLSEETTFGGGGKRRHRTRRGVFSSFGLGPLRFADALASTTKGELDPSGRFHGLVGLSIFEGYRVTLDLPNERILLDPPASEEEGSSYWTISGQLLVGVEAHGLPEPLFILDTGARGTVISMRLAGQVEGARAAGAADVRGFGGRVPDARVVRGVRIGFQGLESPGRELNALDLSLRSTMSGVEVSGFLGMDVLAEQRIVVDTTTRRVRVEEVK